MRMEVKIVHCRYGEISDIAKFMTIVYIVHIIIKRGTYKLKELVFNPLL